MQRLKKILSTAVTVTTISWSIGLGTLIPLLPASAQPGGTIAGADLASGNVTVGASTAKAVVGFNVTGNGTEKIASVSLAIAAVNGLNPNSALATLDTNSATSGLGLVDDTNTNNEGSFSPTTNADTYLTLSSAPTLPTQQLSDFSNASNTGIFQTDGSGNLSAVSGSLSSLSAGDIIFTGNTSTGTNTDTITFGVVSQTSPFRVNNTTDFGNSKTFRVTKIAGTSATYTTGTNGQDVGVSGAYSAPAVGHLVVYWESTQSYATTGIITNATLTAGTGSFAINGSALSQSKTYTISRITGFSERGVTLDGAGSPTSPTSFNAGDVILSSSGGNSYQWHMVSTGGSVPSGIALDGGSVGSTVFQGNSYIAVLTPTATALATDSQTTITAGDVIFGIDYKAASGTINPVLVTTGATGFSSSSLRTVTNMFSGLSIPFWYGTTLGVLTNERTTLPTATIGAYAGDEYYVIARSPASGSSGSLFFAIPTNNGFSSDTGGSLSGMVNFLGTNALIVSLDSTPPTATFGGPPDGQSGVPVEAAFDQGWNEAVSAASTECSGGTCASFTNAMLKACTGADQSTADLACGVSNTTVGSQLCTSVTRSDANTKITCAHTALATGIWHVMTWQNIADTAGNVQGTAITRRVKTGSTGTANTTPPFIQSSQPAPGSQNHPTGAPIRLTFSVAMATTGGGSITDDANIGVFTENFGGAGTAVTTTKSYDAATKTVTLTPSSALTANTSYVVRVNTSATSATTPGIPLPQPYFLGFRTSSGSDSTVPTVLGVSPSTGSTGVSLGATITVGFSEDMDPATIISARVKLAPTADLNTTVAGTVTYNPNSRSASFAPSTALTANTGYTFTVVSGASGVKDLSGNALAQNFTATLTTTATADTAKPSITFSNADNFTVAITFSEAMKISGGANAADNVSNYTLETPVGLTPAQLYPLSGKSVTWNAERKTATITGLALTTGATFKITAATTTQDLSGNAMDDTGTPAKNTAFGTVQNSTTTGGQIGPGSGTIDAGMQGMNPTRVSPMSRGAGVTSNYKVEFLAGTSIPVGGQIVLMFPSGFTLSGAAAIATTNSFCNADMNGPKDGAVTIASVAGDNDAGTITVTTGGAATGANAFLCMDLSGITNSTVPSSEGYTITMQTKDTAGNNRASLQTLTASPFYLGTAGSRTLTVNVFKDANSNNTNNAGEGINGVTVFLFSPATGGQEATTANSTVDGVATFSNLADGEYMIGIKPNASINVAFNSAPQPFTVSASNIVKNFVLSNAAALTISGTITGTNGTKIDVFASSPNGFTKKSITLTGGADAYSLPVSANTTYNLGVGPAIPETFMTPGAPPPPPPTFTFMPPPNREVKVGATNVTSGADFTLTTTNKTITGTVVDTNVAGVSNVGVFCRPNATSTTGTAEGFGTGAQTNASGAFTINVIPGSYLCGVFKPGMPQVADKQITVPSSGANSPTSLTFSLKVDTASAITITGTISDDSGNAIPYAGVNARKVVSSSVTTPVGGGGQNFVGGPTDVNGAYTLYVTAGTWIIEAFAPGFGLLGTKTVTISTASLSGQDFSAQTLSMGTITGTATVDGTTVQGVMVRVEGANGANMVVTDASGIYSAKVPAGSYTVRCFIPGKGECTPLTGVTVTANTTTANQDLTMSAPIAITINVTDGTNPITGAFVDVRDSNGRGNNINVSTSSGVNAVYVVNVPPGTYTVRVGHPAYGKIGETTGVNSTRTITYTASAGQLYAVTGTVSAGGTGLANAWVSLTGSPTGQTSIINVGGQTGADGSFSINVPPGRYGIRADKPGYKSPAQTTVSVSAATSAGTIILTTASRTITGTVTLDSVAVSSAFVDATDGNGGFAVAQTDSSGAYSLAVDNGTWTLRAHSMGYEGGPLTVTVSSNSPSNQTITLSAISGFTIKPEKQETVTPTSGGFFTNSDIGANFKLNIPANALGTGSNAATIKTQTNTAVPTPPTGSVLSKNAVTVSAVDSGGSPVKNLNDDVTIVIPYTEADIPAGGSEAALQIGVYNDSTQGYDTLPTTVDTTANTLTATVSHFSVFAPLLFTSVAAASSSIDLTPPASPSSVKATSDGSKVTLTWGDPSDSDLLRILVLRNAGGSTPISGDPYAYVDKGKGTYTDTAVTAGTTYKYLVRAQDISGNADTNLTSLSVTVTAGASVSTPAPVTATTPPPATVTPPATTTVTPPAATPSPTTPATCSPSIAGCALQPSKVMESAAEFGIALNATDDSALTNFVTNGTSQATVKLGSGERLAVVRDILETLGRASVRAIEQISAGEKPTDRNLAKEQAQVNKALPLFKKMLGVSRAPNFKNTNEDLAWNTLMYRIRFDRDLKKEQKGIVRFKKVMGKNPSSPLDWAAVRAYGYKLAK